MPYGQYDKLLAEHCYCCTCYDSDLGGCTMPSLDREYACSLEDAFRQEEGNANVKE